MDPSEVKGFADQILDEVSRAVIADHETLRTILTGFLAKGHVLIEDMPGTGKTLTARSFASALGLSFSRIQFTPDLLPTDVTGSHIYNEKAGGFEFQSGPVFANIVLADEINRASPKTQAALLEAMEENQVTVDGETKTLPDPFLVIATQNPVEQEGTFVLPEAQKDRFFLKTSLGYPDLDGELELIDRRAERTERTPSVNTVCTPEEVRALQEAPEQVHVEPNLRRYIAEITRQTRDESRVKTGVSPRGTQRLFEGGRALASVQGREYVVPDDLKALAPVVIAHRLILTPDARVNDVEKTDIVREVLEEVEVPTVNYRARPSA